jgi:lipoprotein-releasing system permease protein
MFARQGRATGGILRGSQLVSAKDVLSLGKNLVYGDIESLEIKDDMPSILLGNELANTLNVSINDVVETISPMGRLTPVGSVPRVMRFKVGGIFKTGMYEFDSTLAYADIEETARFLGITGKVSGIEVKIENIYNAPDISIAIQEHLGYPFWTRDWIQMNHNLFAALKLEKIVMFIILTLIIMVASFNIISTLSMMVMEKSKDIGILKSMGATKKSIRNIFMLQGLIIGGIGTIAGLLLSLILCFILGKYQFIELPPDVYYISTLPVRVEWLDVSMVAVAAVIISLFASWYPAVRASRLYPAEALKYE